MGIDRDTLLTCLAEESEPLASDGMQVGFECDARRLPTRRHGFAIDDRDRMIEHYGSLMGTARFAYDEDGRLQHVVYPKPTSAFAPTAQSTYQYDPAGRVISIQHTGLAAGASSHAGGWRFSWDAVGRLSTRSDPNGIARSAKFVTEGFVDELRFDYPDGTNQVIDYRNYDSFGGPGWIDYGGGESTNPTFDAASRLDTASVAPFAGNEQFDVDSDGNRIRYWQGGDNRSLLVDAAHQAYRVERVGNSVRLENFGYDGAGRRELYNEWDEASGAVPATQMLTRSTAYGYDGLGRLSYVTRTGGYAMSLDYGPLGERIRRTEIASTGAQPVVSLYLGGLVELRDIGASGVAQTAVRLIAGPGPAGTVGEVTTAGELRSLLGDAGHNVIRAAVIAGSGPYTKSVYSRRYRAFGAVGFPSGTVLVERGFAGQVPEGQSGVVYMNARHYDPAHGRFLQPDPLGVESDQPYAYAANNPFVFFDPLGLSPASLSGILPSHYQSIGLGRVSNGLSDYSRLLSDAAGSYGGELEFRSQDASAAGNYGGAFGYATAAGIIDKGSQALSFASGALEPAAIAITIATGIGGFGPRAVAQPAGQLFDDAVSTVTRARGGPDFVVTLRGEAIPVPIGATGPIPTRAPGVQFLEGSGGPGLNPRVSGVRVMDANANQGPRAVYMNRSGQTVDPATGHPLSNKDQGAHHYLIPWE